MLKIFLLSALFLTTLGSQNCFNNLGNVRSDLDPIYKEDDSSVSLDQCKSVCDNWDTDCASSSFSTANCNNYHCVAGVLTDVGCDLYSDIGSWFLNDEVARDQAFKICDEDCWVTFNSQENSNEADELFVYSGDYSIGDCQAKCEEYNAGVNSRQDDSEFCYGVTGTDTECILVKEIDVTTDLEMSNDPSAHYRQFACDIDTTQSSIKLFDPNAEEEEEEEAETVSTTTVVDANGNVSCNQTEVFSECDFTGSSAIVNLVVMELTFEPQSWCIPEYQTLTLHNQYDLGGETYVHTDSVSCATDITYSFLQKNRGTRHKISHAHTHASA